MIKSQAPANVTIQDSTFIMEYDNFNNVDTFEFSDSNYCTLEDDSGIQNLVIQKNIFTATGNGEGVYKHLYSTYFETNPRYLVVNITENKFTHFSLNAILIDVEFYAHGDVDISDNEFYNATALRDLVYINSHDHIVSTSNRFIDCIEHGGSFFTVKGTNYVEVHDLYITGTQYHEGESQASVIKIDTEQDGVCFLEKLLFENNSVLSNILEIFDSVGEVSIKDSTFRNELLSSETNYINIHNPYKLIISNLTFISCEDDHAFSSEALLILISHINIAKEGEVRISNINAVDTQVSFLRLSSLYGVTEELKTISIDHVFITNATYETRNDLIIIGPYDTKQNIQVTLSYLFFEYLDFTKFANILHIKQQAQSSLVLEHSVFKDMIGGKILVEATNLQDDSEKAKMIMNNVTAYDNDFKFASFIVQEHHSELSIKNSAFYRNSAMFRGVVLELTEGTSYTHIFNSSFNKNSGLEGGVFYINGPSQLDVHDSYFSSNFAVLASIAYVINEGSLNIEN